MKQKLFYGWYIAAAGAGTNFVVLSITLLGFGVFIEGFRVTYGWSVTAIALGYSIRTLEVGLFAPFTGYIADRIGPRRMAVTGVAIISLSLLIFSQATTLPLYYAASIVMALGQSIGGPNAFTLAIMRWFSRRRGNAMSIVTTGNAASYVATIALTSLIAVTGFHGAFVVLSILVAVVCIPMALVIRDRPEDMGLKPDGDAPEPGISGDTADKAQRERNFTVAQALRSMNFYLLVFAMAAGSASQLAWVVFQVPHLVAQGFSVAIVGIMALCYGLAAIPMRWCAGWLGDTFGRTGAYSLAVCLMALGHCFFAFVTPEQWWLFIPFFLIFSMGHAGWMVLNNTLPADFFGSRNFATIRGLVSALQIPVSVVLPLIMGWVYDTQGNYAMAYIGIAVFVLLGGLSLTLAKK